ncbi:MAG: hypothetical protein ACI957_003212 [Verrucomicrobiales bacterium]
MQIYCPNCALQITVDEGLIGSKGQCPRCSYKFVIDQEHRHPPDADDLGTAPTIKIVNEDGFDFNLGGSRGGPWSDSNSFVASMAGLLLLVTACVAVGWMSRFETTPNWTRLPASWHQPFAYGALAMLVTSMSMEVFGRIRRFEHLLTSLPFVLSMTMLALFMVNLSGACALGGLNAHLGMSITATLISTAALAFSFHLGARPEMDRSMLLIIIALAIGALLVAAYLGMPRQR